MIAVCAVQRIPHLTNNVCKINIRNHPEIVKSFIYLFFSFFSFLLNVLVDFQTVNNNHNNNNKYPKKHEMNN
jgi:hypothetical protein